MYFVHMLFEFKLLLPGLCHFLLKLLFLKVKQLLFLFYASHIGFADLSADLQVKVSLGFVRLDPIVLLHIKNHFSFLDIEVFRLALSNCSRRRFKSPDGFRFCASSFDRVLIISNTFLRHLHPPIGRVLLLFLTLLPFVGLKLIVVSFDLFEELLLMFEHGHLF